MYKDNAHITEGGDDSTAIKRSPLCYSSVLLLLEALYLGIGLRRPVEHRLDVLVAVRQRGGAVGLRGGGEGGEAVLLGRLPRLPEHAHRPEPERHTRQRAHRLLDLGYVQAHHVLFEEDLFI